MRILELLSSINLQYLLCPHHQQAQRGEFMKKDPWILRGKRETIIVCIIEFSTIACFIS